MATTYNFTDGSIVGQMIPPRMEIVTTQPTIIRNVVDFTKQNLDESADDIAQVLNVPAGTLVLFAGIRIITAGTTNATVNFGVTGGVVDAWGDGVALDATAGTVTQVAIEPQYLAASDTLDIIGTDDTASVDIDAVIEVYACCIKVQDSY